MASDRLAELAERSVDLATALEQLRGAGLQEVVGGHDVLADADASDAELDEFLSLAVRAAPDHVLFGLALSLPACIVRRGAGREALDYCLSERQLTERQREHVHTRMDKIPRPGETVCAGHRRLRGSAGFGGRTMLYQTFLAKNIQHIVAECPGDLAEFLLDPRFGPQGLNLDCLVLAIEHSPEPARFVRHWTGWLADGRFDTATTERGSVGVMYSYLDVHWGEPRFTEVSAVAHQRLVTLLASQDTVSEAWRHLEGLLGCEYAGAREVVAALGRSGQQLTGAQRETLRYPLAALFALANGREQGRSYDYWFDLALQNRPPDSG